MLPKSIRKLPHIDENVSLERFRRQFACRSVPGAVPHESRKLKSRLFGRKLCSKGRFWDPWKIEKRSKIILVSIDGHFDLRKMPFGRGSEKTRKLHEQSVAKSKVFDGSEPRLALYSSLISHFCNFRKKSKNRCQKGAQKLWFLIQNATLDAQGSIYPTFFDDFGK